jgi:integrase
VSDSNKRSRYRLTAKQIKSTDLEPSQLRMKLADGSGLTLLIRRGVNGTGKYWQLRYLDPITGKEQTASLGTFPKVTLAKARRKAENIREDLLEGITPKDRERESKQTIAAARKANEATFKSVADDWYQECIDDGVWTSVKHQRVVVESLELHVFPYIGDQPISDITAPDIRALVRRIGKAGTWETCQRVLQRINMIYRWAEDEGLVDNIPTRPAQRWISRTRPEESQGRNYAFLTPTELPELASALEQEHEFMDRQTYLAIQLQALTFVRPGELRTAEWDHIDLDAALWTIPAANMKIKREHLVPLSKPALAVLQELVDITGNRSWAFPGKYTPRKCMSEATVNMAIKRLSPDADGKGAFVGRHTAHSFRHSASTYLNEYRKGDLQPYRGDPVELQLAHLDKNAVRRRYNQATHLELRREMMEVWGQYWLQCKAKPGTVLDLSEARKLMQ